MTKTKYELINQQRQSSNRKSFIIQTSLLSLLCIVVFFAVYMTWSEIYNYNKRLNIPQKSNGIPSLWFKRLNLYAEIGSQHSSEASNSSKGSNSNDEDEKIVTQPSKFGNFIYASEQEKYKHGSKKLICYYTTPRFSSKKIKEDTLSVKSINANLCTHLNIGIIEISNCSLVIDTDLIHAFKDSNILKAQNENLKVLLWVGGADESGGFKEMVASHANRKRFINSLKETFEKFGLDGVDLDWEFPNGSNSERIHFMQLLHEIRREYQREHRTYLLSLAVAAPSIFVDMCYDVPMINDNVDFVNLMSYDYHFYSRSTPYVGLNAPLYRRSDEIGLFATLNINYSVNYWISKGLDRSKIIIGLPTYGHSFRLVNPFNTRLGAPSEDVGRVGVLGFTSYSEVCWFQKSNFNVRMEYDLETCSPFMYAGLEWISYEDERSIECKTNYAKKAHVGGIMVFSLNTDDYKLTCDEKSKTPHGASRDFPLLRKIHSILFENSAN